MFGIYIVVGKTRRMWRKKQIRNSGIDTPDECGTECFHTAFTKSNVSTTALHWRGFSGSPFKASQHKHRLFQGLYNRSTEESLDELNRLAQTLRNCQ